MPVINTYDKPAGEIKFGNYVFGQKVAGAYPKRVNTRIVLEQPVDGKTEWVFKLTDMLEVGVSERTPEEEAARAAEHKAERERHFVKNVKGWAEEAVKEPALAAKERADRLKNGWGMLDYQSLQAEVTAAAHHDKGKQILAIFQSAKDGTFHFHPEVEDCVWERGEDGYQHCQVASNYTELDVAKQIVQRQIHELTQWGMRTRVLSRSTSLFANLCEDMQVQATADFLNAMQYASYGIIEIPGR